MPDIDKISQKTARRRQLRWWHILAVGLIIFILGAALVWHNRYDILKDQTQKWLAGQGYEAHFDIARISLSNARIKNVQITKDGAAVLSAKALAVDFDYKKIRSGQFDRLKITQASLALHVDEHGNFTDDWIPQSSGSSDGETMVPPNGISVEDADINWITPYGQITTRIDADIANVNEWVIDVEMPKAHLSANGNALNIGANVSVFSDGPDAFRVSGTLAATDIVSATLTAKTLDSDFQYLISRGENKELKAVGTNTLDFESLAAAGIAIANNTGKFEIDALYNQDLKTIDNMQAKWDVNADLVQLVDAQRRLDMARTITAAKAVEMAPIGQYFIPEITKNAQALLAGSDVVGAGTFHLTRAGYTANLTTPLRIKAKGQSVRITPIPDKPLAVFDRAQERIDMRADVNWQSSARLRAQDLQLQAISKTGFDMAGMSRVQTVLKSSDTWTQSTDEGPAHLAPFDFTVSYINRDEKRHVRLGGDVTYDGPVPGGVARGLVAGGEITMDMSGDDFVLSYGPGGPVKLASFANATGWRARDIGFTVIDGKRLLERKSGARPFQAVLSQVSANLSSPDDDRHLDMQISTMNVAANFAQNPQPWAIKFEDLQIKSDDFPAPGTLIKSQGGDVHVAMSLGSDLKFELSSPNTTASTDNIMISALAITALGTPDNMTFNYDTPKVMLKNADVPSLPMRGDGRLVGGVLSGQAVSFFPRTKNMPVNVEFSAKDGTGSAHIDIAHLLFSPSGLQPQDFAPALRGKIAEVRGAVSAQFDVAFGGGQLTQSAGQVQLLGLDVGTLVGPFTNIETNLEFSSMFPLETKGVQRAKIGGFDAGFPLKDGEIVFEIVEDGIRIDKAAWPVFSTEDNAGIGLISILPTQWRFGGVKNRLTVRVQDLSLGAIAQELGKGKFEATGQITGELPIVVDGVNVTVDNGILQVKNGGNIRYSSEATNALIEKGAPTDSQALQTGDYTGLAFRALKDFHYNKLEARLNGPLDGKMALRFVFDGQNQEVLNGQSFEFDLNLTGELANLARNLAKSFSNQSRMKEILELSGAQ